MGKHLASPKGHLDVHAHSSCPGASLSFSCPAGMDHRPRESVSAVASAHRDDQGAAPAVGRKAKRRQDQLPHAPDDLRNYAYEGDGSSPGSLSSCCSGHGRTPSGNQL